MTSNAIHSGMRRLRTLLLAAALLAAPALSSAALFVSVNFAPPPIPVYVQPFAPGPDFIWIPGYWAYGPEGYYWVPGTWVLAPYAGALWTPGYWAWNGAAYFWHAGYWGPRVGYYGGINYGCGYFGVGYVGGYWSGGHFFYNSAVTHVDVTRIHNVYNRTVVENNVRVSYNGGPGGVQHVPTAEERLADRDAHRAATPAQTRHEGFAASHRELLASVNHGAPTLAATPRAGAFRAAQVNAGPHGAAGPQGTHVERFHADRGYAQGGAPNTGPAQVRSYEAPHGAPSEHMPRGEGTPHAHPGAEHREGEGRPAR